MNILQEIAEKTRQRIENEKQQISTELLLEKIKQNCAKTSTHVSFKEALQAPGMSYICEVKKASPSKGLIAPDFPYLQIPVLRKDFVVDEYMIYQAKALGASAVLLICAILSDEQLYSYRKLAESLGMDALVEAHDEEEVQRALRAGAEIIGVNNRDLRTFQVDMDNSIRLRELAPEHVVFVSESGIRTAEDIRRLREHNIQAVLIGETLMRSSDKKEALEMLNGSPLGKCV